MCQVRSSFFMAAVSRKTTQELILHSNGNQFWIPEIMMLKGQSHQDLALLENPMKLLV